MAEINLDLKSIDATKLRIPINELRMGDNYKDVTRESTDKLKRSLMRFGQRKPILLDGREGKTGMILGGNHQFVAIGEIIKENNWKYGDRVWVDIVMPKNDKDAKLYSLVDNAQYDIPTTERLAEWGAELVDAPEIEIIPVITDYQTLTLKEVYEEVAPDSEVVEDEAPEVSQEEPKSKRGEIYQLGKHRLMCGDSTKIEDVEKLMNGQKADMVFTDPPYGVSYQSNMRTKSDKFDVLKNDDVIITDWIAPALQFSTGWFLFCTTWKVFSFWHLAGEVIGNLSNLIIWNKGGGGIGDLEGTLLTDYEMVLAYNRGNKVIGKRIGSVWDIHKDDVNSYEHATQKPVQLAGTAIKTLSNGSVLDLFGGSGSTLIACEQLNRTCFMMELDEKYCDVIRKRYAKFIGKEEQWQETTPQVL